MGFDSQDNEEETRPKDRAAGISTCHILSHFYPVLMPHSGSCCTILRLVGEGSWAGGDFSSFEALVNVSADRNSGEFQS